jgi:transposase
MKNSKVKRSIHGVRRVFSEEIRKQTVKDIEAGKCSVMEASIELGVSNTAIYKWIDRYSRYLLKGKTMVVEDQSEAYRSRELEKRIKELEAALGRKQMEIDLLNKVIDIANDELHTDIKKNFSKERSTGTGGTKAEGTDTK